MKIAIDETERRRSIQEKYNKEHGIVPKTIIKSIKDAITNEVEEEKIEKQKYSKKELNNMIIRLETEMKEAASRLDFERATELRDIIFELKDLN
jgi:excinuclease ABC subunit B